MIIGPSDRSQTCGLLVPNQALYQLSYTRIHLTIAVLYIKLRVAVRWDIPTLQSSHIFIPWMVNCTTTRYGLTKPTLALRSPGILIGISLTSKAYSHWYRHGNLCSINLSCLGYHHIGEFLRCTNTMTTIEGVIQPYSRLPLIYINSISNTVEPYIISGHRVYEKESRIVWSNTVPSSIGCFGFQGHSIWFGTIWYSMMVRRISWPGDWNPSLIWTIIPLVPEVGLEPTVVFRHLILSQAPKPIRILRHI